MSNKSQKPYCRVETSNHNMHEEPIASKKYVPPNRILLEKVSQNKNRILLEKASHRNDYNYNKDDFPSISKDNSKIKNQTMNFANIINKEEIKIKDEKVYIKPGWVEMTCDKKTKKIVFNYGDETDERKMINKNKELKDNMITYALVYNMIARWQCYRDADVEFLGEESEYFDKPSLFDLCDDDIVCDDESENSDEDDDEYNNHLLH